MDNALAIKVSTKSVRTLYYVSNKDVLKTAKLVTHQTPTTVLPAYKNMPVQTKKQELAIATLLFTQPVQTLLNAPAKDKILKFPKKMSVYVKEAQLKYLLTLLNVKSPNNSSVSKTAKLVTAQIFTIV